MPLYICSTTYFFRETGQRLEPNDTVELSQASYEKYRIMHPGLLRPAPMNTQHQPAQIRAEVASAPAEPEAAPAQEEVKLEAAPEVQPEAAPAEPGTPAVPVETAPASPDVPAEGEPKPKGKSRAKKA